LCTAADLVAEDDVGLVVAKAVTDSRTTKTVAILANALTQNDTIASWKELSGQTPDRKDSSAEEMQQKIDGENMPCVTAVQMLLMLHSQVLSSANFFLPVISCKSTSLCMHASSCVHSACYGRKHTSDAINGKLPCLVSWTLSCTIEMLLTTCVPSQHCAGTAPTGCNCGNADAEGFAALVPTLIKTIWVGGCFKQLHSATQEDVLFASEPYPDIKSQTVKEYMQQFL